MRAESSPPPPHTHTFVPASAEPIALTQGRAGVGPGTLYRHFPSREALIAALLQARYDELFARRDAIEGEKQLLAAP